MKRRITVRRWLRRMVQVAFLALFLGLVLATRPVPGQLPSEWLKVFFFFDPLILVLTGIAAWGIPTLEPIPKWHFLK